jgi:hypothetical protein
MSVPDIMDDTFSFAEGGQEAFLIQTANGDESITSFWRV